jgi:hypothetical protein
MRPPVLPIIREMAKTLAKLVSMVYAGGLSGGRGPFPVSLLLPGIDPPRDKARADGDRQTHSPNAREPCAHILQ